MAEQGVEANKWLLRLDEGMQNEFRVDAHYKRGWKGIETS